MRHVNRFSRESPAAECGKEETQSYSTSIEHVVVSSTLPYQQVIGTLESRLGTIAWGKVGQQLFATHASWDQATQKLNRSWEQVVCPSSTTQVEQKLEALVAETE